MYNGSAIPPADAAIGLAEYSNANFFSKDTIFKGQPHPNMEDVNQWDVKVFNTGDGVMYRMYMGKDVGEPMQFLASEALLYKYLDRYPNPMWVLQGRALQLDDACYSEYAQKLIPRAIGYSAKALDYFFRGKLEITPPARYLYGIADGSEFIVPYAHQFTQIKAKVRNITPNEEIGSGTLVAVARYKLRSDYMSNLEFDPPQNPPEGDYSYSTSAEISAGNLNSATPEEFIFDFNGDPIPAGVTDLYLFIVFKGTLGLEENTAVAVGTLDLKEPTHVCVFNSTDRFYLDGVLRTKNEILDNPALLDRVDAFRNGGDPPSPGEPNFYPYPVNTWVSFYPLSGEPPAQAHAFWANMPAGGYGRLIVLTDESELNYRVVRDTDLEDPPVIDMVSPIDVGIVYQSHFDLATQQWVFYKDPVKVFRAIKNHAWSSYIEFYPTTDYINLAPWESWEHVLMDGNELIPPTPVTYINR